MGCYLRCDMAGAAGAAALRSAPPHATPSPPPLRPRAPRGRRCSCLPASWEAHAAAPPAFKLPPVHLTYNDAEAEALLQQHVCGGDGSGTHAAVCLGMDTESRPVAAAWAAAAGWRCCSWPRHALCCCCRCTGWRARGR